MSLESTPKRIKSARNHQVSFLSFQDAPEYVKGNNHILCGYRPEMSLCRCMNTIFMWHNETLNIWSHAIGFLVFLGFFVNSLLVARSLPILIFETGCMYVFIVSASFHTLLCISKKYMEFWRKMDFCAIVVVMFSMFWPFVWYVFDSPVWRTVYLSVAAGISALCISLLMTPQLQTNAFRLVRPLVFTILGLWGCTPVVHATIVCWQPAIGFCYLQLGLHVVGAVFYATQWPERSFSRCYTVNSHFIFHVFILLGLVSFHWGCYSILLS